MSTRARIVKEVSNFARFWAWREVARSGYRPGFWGPDPNICVCIKSTHPSWSTNPNYWDICDRHQKEFDIEGDHFRGIPLNIITEKLFSKNGIKELVEKVFRRQKVYLKSGYNFSEILDLAKKHFEAIPFDQIIFAGYVSSQHYGYGEGTASSCYFLTANNDYKDAYGG